MADMSYPSHNLCLLFWTRIFLLRYAILSFTQQHRLSITMLLPYALTLSEMHLNYTLRIYSVALMILLTPLKSPKSIRNTSPISETKIIRQMAF